MLCTVSKNAERERNRKVLLKSLDLSTAALICLSLEVAGNWQETLSESRTQELFMSIQMVSNLNFVHQNPRI